VRPDIFQDSRFATREARIAHQGELIALLGAVFSTRDRAEWCRRLEARDVPHAPMYDTSEALQDPQALHLGLEIEGRHPTLGRWRTVRSPVSFDGRRDSEVVPPPLLGEHDREIRDDLKTRAAAARP
jgi:crotonobetainyl-CoA:carnitine CoA-transferase CaiB-like acyl-CoA transferase